MKPLNGSVEASSILEKVIWNVNKEQMSWNINLNNLFFLQNSYFVVPEIYCTLIVLHISQDNYLTTLFFHEVAMDKKSGLLLLARLIKSFWLLPFCPTLFSYQLLYIGGNQQQWVTKFLTTHIWKLHRPGVCSKAWKENVSFLNK